jgi:hypothetical protein
VIKAGAGREAAPGAHDETGGGFRFEHQGLNALARRKPGYFLPGFRAGSPQGV